MTTSIQGSILSTKYYLTKTTMKTKLGYKTLLNQNSRVISMSTASYGIEWNRDVNEDMEKTDCKLKGNVNFIIKNI